VVVAVEVVDLLQHRVVYLLCKELQVVQVVVHLFQLVHLEAQVILLHLLLLKVIMVEQLVVHQMDMQVVAVEFVELEVMAEAHQEQLVRVEQEKILHLYFQDLLSQELEVVEVEDIIIQLLPQEKVEMLIQ
jgi:hypothetical protein